MNHRNQDMVRIAAALIVAYPERYMERDGELRAKRIEADAHHILQALPEWKPDKVDDTNDHPVPSASPVLPTVRGTRKRLRKS